MFKQPTYCLKMATDVTNRDYDWENEHLYKPMPSHIPLKMTNNLRVLIHVSRRIIITTDGKEDRKIVNRKGSLTPATIAVISDLTLTGTVVTWRPISSEFFNIKHSW